MPSVCKMLVRHESRSQYPDYAGFKNKVIQTGMKNATVDHTGEVLIYAFKQEFVPYTAHFNSKHDCVASSAHLTLGPWSSKATPESLMHILEQDLVAEGFNIKPHEQRRRCKYYNGQSCQKSVYKLVFLF